MKRRIRNQGMLIQLSLMVFGMAGLSSILASVVDWVVLEVMTVVLALAAMAMLVKGVVGYTRAMREQKRIKDDW